MPHLPMSSLTLLDQSLRDRSSLTETRAILEKIEKCCYAVDRKLNLADVLNDRANYQSLLKLFGPEGIGVGIQLVLKIALSDYLSASFCVDVEVEGRKRIDFLYRSIAGWKQFDLVLCFNFPEQESDADDDDLRSIQVLNPKSKAHWSHIEKIPQGTLVSIFIKTTFGTRSRTQEEVAHERIKAIFELVQSRKDLDEESFAPVAQIHPNKSTPTTQSRPLAKRPSPKLKSGFGMSRLTSSKSGSKLAMSFQVIVNKTDTFIHAGNAHLIITHLANYSGRTEMYVMRGTKNPIALDPDSIWSAEIRNGETVVFDFYGQKPSEEFLKELANRTNKYTQMDKLVNE